MKKQRKRDRSAGRERALQGHRVEGYSRAVMTQVSEARIEGYEIQALERQGKRVRIQGIQ